MMEGRGEAGQVSVEVKRGTEQELELKMVDEVEIGSERDGEGYVNNGVVVNGEDECDNSYVMVEDMAERGNASEVSVEVSDSEVLGESGVEEDVVEGLDGGQNAEDAEAPCAVENDVSLLSNDAEESRVGEPNMDEVKKDMVEEVEIVDNEAEQGELGNTLKVQETVEVEYSNKLEDVHGTVNVTPNGLERKQEQIISDRAVENGDADFDEISSPKAEEKLDSGIEVIESNESEHALPTVVDEEAEQGEVRNTLKVEETVEVEYSNKLEAVHETVYVTPNGLESKAEQYISDGAVETGDADVDGISSPKADEKLDSGIEVIESNDSEHALATVVDVEAEQGEVRNTFKVEETVEVEYSNKMEDVCETVNITPNGKPEQISSDGVVENGDADIEISNPNVEEKLDSEIEIIESNESEHAKVELKKESNEEYSLYKIEKQDFEDLMELEKECNEEISLDKRGNQESEDLAPSDARVNLMELEQAGHNNLIDALLPGKNVTVNKEPHLSEEGHKLVNKSEVSSDVKENGKCESFIPSDEVDFCREEQNNSANVLTVEYNAEFTNSVIPNEHETAASAILKMITVNGDNDDKNNVDSDASLCQIKKSEAANVTLTVQEENGLECETQADVNNSETTASAISKMITVNGNENDGNNIDSDVSSCKNLKSEAANAILTEQEENELDCETQACVNDDETAEAEQTMSKETLLNSVNQEKYELAGSCPATECAVEVEEPATDSGDSNTPIDNEWPELSYYTSKRKISVKLISQVHGSQESEIRESEEIHLADRDRKEVHTGSPEDDNFTGNQKEVVDASHSEDSGNACPDLGTSKEISQAGQSTTWADYNDQTNGVSSPSVLSTVGHSHSISDGVVSAANLDNVVASSESGSKDDETNLNGTLEGSKVETSSEEDSSLALVDNEVHRRPFFFLIKVPRFEDDEIREQIKFAQQDVDEKTKLRDSYKIPIQTKKDICMDFNNDLEAAKLKEKAARDNLKAKRKEIDVAQAVIDKVNNAMTVEDIDGSIHIMEHRMQHETVPLSEEKQLMREIKRLKHFKEQLSSSIGSQEEIHEALDQKDQIRDHLKSLKRELNLIRSDVQRAEIVTKAAKKKCFDEYAELNKLQLEFKAADGIRQEAFLYLVSLRRELAQKNKFFRMYKDTEKLAHDYALSGDKKSLHSLCVNQVETVMELWNTNDQFRKDYIKCNARSTLRRLKTFDGRSLGLNEEPPSLPNIRNDWTNHSEAVTNSFTQIPPPEESRIHVPSIAEKVVNEPVMDFLNKKVAPKQSKDTTAVSEVSTAPSLEITPAAEEEVKNTKEEEEAEEIRKKEEDAKMERLQLEERAKAKEALERKKRMAERAHARAKLQAEKEAEQREKEREKRLRKKEKRKDGKENGTEKDFIAVNEEQAAITKEANPIEKPVTKRHHKPSHYVKGTKKSTMPLNLRYRNRRKMQMWIWMGLAALAAVAMVLVWFGNLSYLAERKRQGH